MLVNESNKGAVLSILIGKYDFDGPYTSVAELKDRPGLYAVLHYEGDDYELIHIGEAYNVKESLQLSKAAYTSSPMGSIMLVACYTPQRGSRERKLMVEDIQREFDDKPSAEFDHLISAMTPC